MGLKSRFKKALFSFFKYEILNYVQDYRQSVKYIEPPTQYVCHEMRMQEIKVEVRMCQHIPANIAYDEALDRAKKLLFDECDKFIHVDKPQFGGSYHSGLFRLSLFVGLKK